MSSKLLNKKKRLRIFWTSTLFLMFALVGCLILQTGALAQQSASLYSVQQKIVNLTSSQDLQNTEAVVENSKDIEELAQNLNFEKIQQVRYIRTAENTALAK